MSLSDARASIWQNRQHRRHIYFALPRNTFARLRRYFSAGGGPIRSTSVRRVSICFCRSSVSDFDLLSSPFKNSISPRALLALAPACAESLTTETARPPAASTIPTIAKNPILTNILFARTALLADTSAARASSRASSTADGIELCIGLFLFARSKYVWNGTSVL